MIDETRIENLNQNPVQSGDYILYWMQSAQRTKYNHALELAIRKANTLEQPLLVYFGLTADFPAANLRHYQFMLEGLQEVKQQLADRGIKFIVRQEDPAQGVIKLARQASLVVTEKGYLKPERSWRRQVAQALDTPLLQVETNAVVPVEAASDKEEYAAYTLRNKINSQLDHYLQPLASQSINISSLNLDYKTLSLTDLDDITKQLPVDRTVPPVTSFQGGYTKAKKHLTTFIEDKLSQYEKLSNDPTTDYLSHLSPYLHFGQISPLEVALEIQAADCRGTEEFLEQLIVRRELAINFIYYNEHYDGPLKEILPDWAVTTLEKHQTDRREYIYSAEELEAAQTHDPYWNAAQWEMRITGKMHGYMRMYWGKKILEWTPDPATGFQIALQLNNKYLLDGRDANSFAGVAWCFGKHDRAWPERDIFGKVRYMNANGLERKFDIELYVREIARLADDKGITTNLQSVLD